MLFALESYGQAYPAGLAKLFNVSLNGIQQQLKRLEDGGGVVSLIVGRTRLYQFNPRYAFLKELKALIQRAIHSTCQKKKFRSITETGQDREGKVNLYDIELA